MLISCDFDGVLLYHPIRGDENEGAWWKNKPIEGSRNAIWRMLENGHEVYICTARNREDRKIIREWLDVNGFPKLKVTNRKKYGTKLYIDDRAYRFTNWKDVVKLIS